MSPVHDLVCVTEYDFVEEIRASFLEIISVEDIPVYNNVLVYREGLTKADMKIASNRISQIERAEELYGELEASCREDLSKQTTSDKTKNLTQEILTKTRLILDHVMYGVFKLYYIPNLSESEAKKAKVYFPIASDENGLRSILGRGMMADLQNQHPDVYNYIASVQPCNSGDCSWLGTFNKLAALRHQDLVPQTRKETKTMKASSGNVSVSMPVDNPNFSVRQGDNVKVSIGGVPVKFTDSGIEPLGPGLTREIRVWTSFLFEGTDINVLWLTKKAIGEIRSIAEQVFTLLK